MFTANKQIIFLVPDNEINHQLITGEHLSTNIMGEDGVIPAVENAVYCPTIFRQTWHDDILSYSNELAHMSTEGQKENGFMDYTSS